MATVITKEEADAHANAILDRAWGGEEIVIEERGARKLRLVVEADHVRAVPRRAGTRRQFGTLGPISDEEAEEAVRPLPKEYWGYTGDDDD